MYYALHCAGIQVRTLRAEIPPQSPCLMLPWLAVTLLEHLIVGVPLIVFIGIIALYLAAQVNLVADESLQQSSAETCP